MNRSLLTLLCTLLVGGAFASSGCGTGVSIFDPTDGGSDAGGGDGGSDAGHDGIRAA